MKRVNSYKYIAVIAFAVGVLFSALLFVHANADTYTGEIKKGWESRGEGWWQDPTSGYFYYVTVDKKKSSDVYYTTVGQTLQAVVKDGNGNEYLSNTDKISFAYPEAGGEITKEWNQNGKTMIETTFAFTPETCDADTWAWLNSHMKPGAEISSSGIITFHDTSKGNADPLTGLIGKILGKDADGNLITKGDVFDLSNPNEVANAIALYSFFEKYADSHIDKRLIVPILEGEIDISNLTPEEILELLTEDPNDPNAPDDPDDPNDPNKPDDPDDPNGNKPPKKKKNPLDELIEPIGKDIEPHSSGLGFDIPGSLYYATYNYNPEEQFDLGDGIPTSENVRNGYESDEWYGYGIVGYRGDVPSMAGGAEHYWFFKYLPAWNETKEIQTVSYDPATNTTIEDVDIIKYKVTATHPSYMPVKRTVGYYYLRDCNFRLVDELCSFFVLKNYATLE